MQTPENIANPYQPFYNDLFNKINPLGKDVLDSTTIAAFLKTAQGVNVSQLSQIWDLACETSGFTNRGVLNKLGIFICFKFIAAVQQGFPLSPTVLSDPSLEPPRFDTFFQPPLPQQPQSTSFVMTTEKSLSSDWAIGLNDLQKYEAIFDSLGPIDGRLSGNQCRPVLLNSQLPKGILAKIWDLADIDADGFLDRPEFCVALYLVYSALQNDPIPEKLPPTLVPPVKRGIINQTIPREDMPSTHPHALTWSSRASSVASLNIQNQQPSYSPPTVSKNIVPISSSLFDRNLNDWHVEHLGQYESEFAELDKDHDGFVTGNDVRDSFLKFGLSQANLARIWAHVDNQKLGRLNLEQYAKCILLIRECQEGIPSRTRVSISSPVPPQGPLARRDSQISTNSGSGVRPLLPENPRVQELTANIEVMQQKKRKAEEELFQAEADLKVKNSEVKNLEIELLTLEATVKQLRVQKVEANKRLNDLDTRIAKLEVIYGESQQRLQEEENRIQKTKTDILQARENSDNEDKILEQLRIEGQNRNQKLLNARLFLKQQHEKFVSFVDELTHLERRMACQETESIFLKEQMEQMKKILEGVEKDDNNSKQELLEKTFLQENLSNSQQQTTTLPSTFSGPFIKNSDPFMSNNNVSEEDPFLSKSEDGNLKIDNNTNNFADFAKFSS